MTDLASIKGTFRTNLESVSKLVNFDREVQDFTIHNVRTLHQALKEQQRIDNPRLNGERTLQLLERIRENDSLRPRYQTIFNQAVVLLVSYFGSTVGDVFRFGLAKELRNKTNTSLLKEELRVTLQDILEATYDSSDAIPDLFVLKKDISFQDMQSIRRAFDEYVGISMERNADVNNIIVGQACRNVIVHRGGVIDERLVRQVREASPRTLKQLLRADETVVFIPEEIQVLSDSMAAYLNRLCEVVGE